MSQKEGSEWYNKTKELAKLNTIQLGPEDTWAKHKRTDYWKSRYEQILQQVNPPVEDVVPPQYKELTTKGFQNKIKTALKNIGEVPEDFVGQFFQRFDKQKTPLDSKQYDHFVKQFFQNANHEVKLAATQRYDEYAPRLFKPYENEYVRNYTHYENGYRDLIKHANTELGMKTNLALTEDDSEDAVIRNIERVHRQRFNVYAYIGRPEGITTVRGFSQVWHTILTRAFTETPNITTANSKVVLKVHDDEKNYLNHCINISTTRVERKGPRVVEYRMSH